MKDDIRTDRERLEDDYTPTDEDNEARVAKINAQHERDYGVPRWDESDRDEND